MTRCCRQEGRLWACRAGRNPAARFSDALTRRAEVVLIAPDDALRPGVPAWLRCPIPTIPASLATTSADAPPPRTPPPPWFTDRHLCDACGRVAIAHPPRGARECLQLLEAGTTVRELSAEPGVATGGVAEDEPLRVVLFASAGEARRRALLVLLLTWDCMVGAPRLRCG